MKYRTFRNLAVLGGTGVLVASFVGCWALFSGRQSTPDEPSKPPVTATSKPLQQSSEHGPAAPAPAYDASLRPLDRQILDVLSRPAASDKIKDAFPRESYKVNIYRDTPGTNWTRLKVDLDRDEQDDEKWDLENGQPAKRRVSTRDDGTYDKEYRWQGGKWVEKR